MKTITLNRISDNGTSTIGELKFKNLNLVTIEDTYRDKKIKDITRIPAGKYKLIIRKYGGHHERYSEKFPFHKGMLQLENVKGFTDILIHIGNTAKDTSGCILTGLKVRDENFITQSTIAYTRLYQAVIKEIEAGEEVYIKITDNPRVAIKKQVEDVKAVKTKTIENYNKPTPKKWRKVGDSIMGLGTAITSIAAITGQHPALIITATVLTWVGKTWTNFFSE